MMSDGFAAAISFANGIMSQMGHSLGRSLLAATMVRKSADESESAGHEGKWSKLQPAKIELATFSVFGRRDSH
jgi:hypothetical protein